MDINRSIPELAITGSRTVAWQRYDLINHIISRRFPTGCRYLEVGLRNPADCFDRVNATHKESVDPGTEGINEATHKMTSDEYFASECIRREPFNLVFIDGLHLSHQVWKDMNNAREVLSSNGFLIVHDCNPPHWSRAHSVYQHFLAHPSEWNGDVWCAWYFARTQWALASVCVDTDQGVGVFSMSKSAEPIRHTNRFFSYGLMADDRASHLELTSGAEFFQNFDALL